MGKEMIQVGWWGQRWLTYLIGSLPDAPSEAQLKSAARATARLRAEKGRVEAHVATGHGREEVAVLRVKPLAEKDWKRVLQSLDQELTLRLLSGQFGPELEAAFAALGLDLFPPAFRFTCTCRSSEGLSCRHFHALLLGGLTFFDQNPYLWLEMLGRTRTELQAALQARVADAREEAPLTGDRFWETDVRPESIPVSAGDTATAPDALLRRLGPLPLPRESAWVEMHVTRTAGRGEEARSVLTRAARPLDEVLTEYVRYIGEATRALTTGDLPPTYAAEPLPGKPVPLAARLLPEMEAALRQEGALLSVEQLAARCPTSAALAVSQGRSAVVEALPQLPPDMLVLARRYAGPRHAALDGRAFRHIITFDEWRRGRFSADADWHRALEAAGAATDLPPELWAQLSPETGDELWITVADTAGPYLQAELHGRRARRPGLDPEGVTAARTVLKQMAETSQWGISEQEAVAVLLARGHYGRREHQEEAWLLPYQISGLGAERPQRLFTRESRPWQPTFGRSGLRGWGELENAIRWYSVDLLNGGASRTQAEMAVRIVRWWCQTWPGAQERPGSLPALGALLEFLWVKVPREAHRHGVQPERVPGALTGWFSALEQHYPGMAGLYEPHLLACRRGELFAHRLQTLPEPGAPEIEELAWVVEGYRWIGAERCWE